MATITIYKTKAAAMKAVGGLSQTSKMPCKSFGLDAFRCITGSKLRNIKGSTCSNCYACKGNYVRYRDNMKKAFDRRHLAIEREGFVDAMIKLLQGETLFRWHDSGDIQSAAHLDKIIAIAKATPWVKHWLPTRELAIARAAIKAGNVPDNLIIRASAPMIDGKAPAGFLHTSTVHKNEGAQGFACRAVDGACGSCRACWNPDIANVSYGWH